MNYERITNLMSILEEHNRTGRKVKVITNNQLTENELIKQIVLEYDKMCVKLQELENKIKNGTLVELPCKVGDTIYIVLPMGKILEDKVVGYSYDIMGDGTINPKWQYNKTWFTDEAKAEAKLMSDFELYDNYKKAKAEAKELNNG